MRIAIMGSGGIGGYYGARLAAAGHEVTFIARGPHLEALRTEGLRVESALGDLALPPVSATDDPAAVGPVELVVVATKTYDLDAAAQAMRPLVGSQTTVLPLLNGVDNAGRLGAVLGMERVVGGSCTLSSTLVAPGLVRHNTPGERLVFGELSGGGSPRCAAIAAAFHGAGVNAVLSEDIHAELWEKLAFLVPVAAVTCALRRSGPELREDPDVAWMFREAIDEVVRLAATQGVVLREGLAGELVSRMERFPVGTKPSMLVDLEQGRRLELDALSGTVVRMAAEAGLPVPVNRTLYAALKPYEHGPPG